MRLRLQEVSRSLTNRALALRRVLLAGIAVAITWMGQALAVNSVVVESKEVVAGAKNVRIPIYLTNALTARAVVVPLLLLELNPGALCGEVTD